MRFILFFLLWLTPTLFALEYGQVVPIEKRLSYSGKQTLWSTLIPSKSPRFKVSTSVILNAMPNQHRLQGELKMAFRVQMSRFLTPWMRVSHAASSTFLSEIDMRFQYAGDTIFKVNVHTTQITTTTEPPKYIKLNYHWQEVVEHDMYSPTLFLFVLSIAFALLIALTHCRRRRIPKTLS